MEPDLQANIFDRLPDMQNLVHHRDMSNHLDLVFCSDNENNFVCSAKQWFWHLEHIQSPFFIMFFGKLFGFSDNDI